MHSPVGSPILKSIDDAIRAVQCLKNSQAVRFITAVAEELALCFRAGGKILIAGNGGSLCDAAHFAEELTGQFRSRRRALPAIALTEPGHITCTANDFGYEWVFARAIEAYGKPEDLFIGLSTSGNSINMVRAFEQATAMGLKTIAFLGKKGGALKGVAHLEMIIEGFATSDRIQEAHMTAIHLIIEHLESLLFPEKIDVAKS